MKYIPILLFSLSTVFGAYTLKAGKLVNTNEVATMSVQEHYSALTEAYQKEDWQEVVRQGTIVIKNFPETPFVQESLYYLAAGYFNVNELDLANKYLTTYLKKQTALQHFKDAIHYKFLIAQKFQEGAKKHLMGFEMMPKWQPAYEDAQMIYDEVISALPNDDLAAKALFGKAALQLDEEEYRTSVETLQTLIRRFPRNSLAPESYVQIARIYLIQCQEQYPDADFLDLAEINMRKFRQDFPSDDRVAVVEKVFEEMEEIYAHSFYEIGQFFERTKKPHASVLYYHKIIKTFPNTQSAQLSKDRLKVLQPPVESLPAPTPVAPEEIFAPIPESP